MRGRPVAARANLSAPSTASVPELQKNTASRCRRQLLEERLAEQPAHQRAIHLHHVGQVEVQRVVHGLGDDGMVAPDVEDAVAAEKIEVFVAFVVVEVGSLRPDVHPVEADGLRCTWTSVGLRCWLCSS